MNLWACWTHSPLGFAVFLSAFGWESNHAVFLPREHIHIAVVPTRTWIFCFIWFFSPHIAAAIIRDRIWCSLCTYNIFLRIKFRHCKCSSSYSLWTRGRVGLWPLRSIHSILLMCRHYARAYWYFWISHKCNTRRDYEFVLTRRSVYCMFVFALPSSWY